MLRTTRVRRCTTLLVATASAAALGLTGVAPAVAQDAGGQHRLTGKAREAGLTLQQGGQMGWRTPMASSAKASRAMQPTAVAGIKGIDVSGYQGNVNWASYWSQGKRFAYTKATEATSYTNPYFSQQYTGSYKQGFIRGAYHFAVPNSSSGATQAAYFVKHGGGWSGDGKTLPGVLDIEYNPYGSTCYGLSAASMVSWISSFTSKYKSLTGRDAVIYSTTDWWKTCTGNSTKFHTTNPLWVARYASSVGSLPGSWPTYTFWQYSSSPIDQDTFNGSAARLKALALG